MKRSFFVSGRKIEKLTPLPAIGQRWKLKYTEEECIQNVQKLEGERREFQLGFFERERKTGTVIIGEKPDRGIWIVMRNPKNPHPRSKPYAIKKEWLDRYKFDSFEFEDEEEFADLADQYDGKL